MVESFKIIACADLHMSNRLPFARPTEKGKTDRFEDQLKLLDRIGKRARKEHAEAILILGDLFDKSLIDAVTLTHTIEAIVDFGVDTYILPGNHDANSIRGGRFTVEAFGAMRNPNIHVIGEQAGQRLEIEAGKTKWVFHPVAFKPVPEMTEEIEAVKMELNKKEKNVLLFHGSVFGSHHMGWTCDEGLDPDSICENFDFVFAGHFHEHQSFGGGGIYLGAPMQHHFGDAGRGAGFWVFEFTEKGYVKRSFVDGKAPEFYLCSDLDEEYEAKKGDYLRYEISATHAEWTKIKPTAQIKIDALNAAGIKAEYKHKPIYHHEARLKSTESIKAGLSMESAIKEYVQSAEVQTIGLDEALLKTIGVDLLEKARAINGLD